MSYQKLSDKELEEKLVELQNVIKSKKEMPQNIDRVLLLRYLKFFNGQVDKAFKRLVANMELRKHYSNIFTNRDPQNPQLRRLIDQVEMVPLPKLTTENSRILILRLIDFNPENLIFDDAVTVFTMVYDTSIITPEEQSLADDEIVIFDLKGLTSKHITRMNLSTLRCFIKYMVDAHPLRIKQVHIVNSSSLLDKLMLILRPFLGSKAMKAIHFHAPNTTTLFDFVSKDVLPVEFGGTSYSIETPKWYWIRQTENHRDYLLDDSRWKITPKKEKDIDLMDESFNYLGFC